MKLYIQNVIQNSTFYGKRWRQPEISKNIRPKTVSSERNLF